MKLRVNNQMLNNVVGETYKGYEALFSEINAMESDINNLKKVWQGEEALIYYARIDNYLNILKSIPETYNTFAKFMDKANKLYKEADMQFASDIDRVRND